MYVQIDRFDLSWQSVLSCKGRSLSLGKEWIEIGGRFRNVREQLYEIYMIFKCLFYVLLLNANIPLSDDSRGLLQELTHKLNIVSAVNIDFRGKKLTEAMCRDTVII